MRNKNDHFKFRVKAIYEPHSVKEEIGGGRMGLELINEFGKMLDTLSDSRGLFNLEKLAYQGLMLVTIETIMKRLTKSCPGIYGWCVIDGLKPARSIAFQIHGSHANPHRGINCVHVEVFLAIRALEAGIFTI